MKPKKVPPPLFGPSGRKWLDVSGLVAKYKIAQGPEAFSTPEPAPEPRKPAQGASGNINAAKPQGLTTEQRMQQPPPSSEPLPQNRSTPSSQEDKRVLHDAGFISDENLDQDIETYGEDRPISEELPGYVEEQKQRFQQSLHEARSFVDQYFDDEAGGDNADRYKKPDEYANWAADVIGSIARGDRLDEEMVNNIRDTAWLKAYELWRQRHGGGE